MTKALIVAQESKTLKDSGLSSHHANNLLKLVLLLLE